VATAPFAGDPRDQLAELYRSWTRWCNESPLTEEWTLTEIISDQGTVVIDSEQRLIGRAETHALAEQFPY